MADRTFMPRICICIAPVCIEDVICFAAGRENAEVLFGDRLVADN